MEKAPEPQPPDVAFSLSELARRYRAQTPSREAEPRRPRASANAERALGTEHPDVVTVLENYAALLRQLNREAEAGALELRARTIRATRAPADGTV